ncbi:NAD(P)-dependent oxidoreductase [Celeribacter indicus]|uniref:6-phosphogluconate dehydrogenase n=1 Tax=Celeribacter indicus TaxID=1208324 RepID=A0A0B5E9Z8_9RHOB|nr:NAD(P)-dependent oxidoreductase [Celeribacter indicus]AJE49142.1 6-phosphogluconate dehydrogenase [Celeribacter indicus]SDX17454.1 3-hydroxyisobutyrate dehydrogenase [Celeribacter indicus]
MTDLVTGYIGLGAMGGALARRLLLSRPLHVFDLNPGTRAEFEALGATPAASPEALARICDVVMICVPRSADVRRVLFGEGGASAGLTAGKIVVDQTSGDPIETRAMAAELAQAGVAMVDAPVSGGARGAEAGTIAIMTGGEAETLDRLAPVFAQISPNVTRCGGIGAGQVMKLINNMISTCNRFAMLEGVAMGVKNGLSLDVMTDVLNSGGARSRSSEVMLRNIAAGGPPADFALDLMLKDLNLAAGLGQQSGAPLQFGQMARAMLQAASNTLAPGAKLDEIAGFVAAQSGTEFTPDG